jgi:chromosome segregation ATPase
LKKQLTQESSKTLSAEQQVAALQSQLEHREETLRKQFSEESRATRVKLSKTRQRLEEVELWLAEVKASKQQVENQAQQEMGVLQDSLKDMSSQWDAFRDETQLLLKERDKQLDEEMKLKDLVWLEEFKASKQQVENQAQQEMGVLHDSLKEMSSQWDAFRDETQRLLKERDQQLDEEKKLKDLVESLEQQVENSLSHQESLQNELAKETHKATTALEEVASMKAELAEQNATAQERLQEDKDKFKTNEADLNRRLEEVQVEVQKIRADKEQAVLQAQKEMESLKQTLQEHQAHVEATVNENQTLLREPDSKRENSSRKELKTTIESLKEELRSTISAQQSEVTALQKQLDERIEMMKSAIKEASDWKKKTEELEGVIRQRQSELSLKSESTNHELATARKQLERVKLELEAEKADKQDLAEQSKRDLMELQEHLQQDKRKMNVTRDVNQYLVEQRKSMQKMDREATEQLQSLERRQQLNTKAREDDMASLRQQLDEQTKRAESAALEASELKSKLNEGNSVQKQLSDTERELEATQQNLAFIKRRKASRVT